MSKELTNIVREIAVITAVFKFPESRKANFITRPRSNCWYGVSPGCTSYLSSSEFCINGLGDVAFSAGALMEFRLAVSVCVAVSTQGTSVYVFGFLSLIFSNAISVFVGQRKKKTDKLLNKKQA